MNLQQIDNEELMPNRVSVLNKSNSIILHRSNWDSDAGITYAVRRINGLEEDAIKNAIEKGTRIDLPWCSELKLSVNDIKIYGDFNINNKSHRDVIKSMRLAGPDGSYMPSGFSYKDACVNSYPKINYKYTICFKHMFYFAYCYTVIGRPERIAIYTYTKRQHKARLKSFKNEKLRPVEGGNNHKPTLQPKLNKSRVYRCKRKHMATAIDMFSNKEYKVSMNVKTGKLIYE